MKRIWKPSFEDPRNIRDPSLLFLLCGIFAAGVFFAQSSSYFSQVWNCPLWVSSAWMNTGLAVAIFLFASKENQFPIADKWIPLARWVQSASWFGYLPGFMVLLIAWVWMRGQVSFSGTLSSMQLSAISWVPIVEEFVFRKGVGPLLRRYSVSTLWGSYLSILLFSFLHVCPTFLHVWEGKIGLPLGPLFLGCACEFLYALTGRVAPCVFLHSACNGVVILGFDKFYF